MASISLCGSVGANTRGIACDVRRGNILAIILGSASFNTSEYATSAAFKTALQGYLKLETGLSDKLYPFPQARTITDNTEAPTNATLGDGTVVPIREGKPAYTVESLIGSLQEKQMRKFNGQIVPVFIFDDNGRVWGKQDINGDFVGINAQLYTQGAGFGNFSDAKTTKTTVSFQSAKDFFDFGAFAQTDFDVSDLQGLYDVTLTELSHVSNAYKIAANVKTLNINSPVNMYDTYSTQLANGSMWVAKTGATFGTTLAITSVVVDAATKSWVVTFDTTAFGALASLAKIKLSLVPPTALEAGSVFDIESVPLIITKP